MSVNKFKQITFLIIFNLLKANSLNVIKHYKFKTFANLKLRLLIFHNLLAHCRQNKKS